MHSLLPSLAAFLAALGLLPGVVVVQEPPGAAGWAAVGTLLNANTSLAGAQWVVATTATLEVGNTAVCAIGSDEGVSNTTPTSGGSIDSITDAASNTWTEVYSWCWYGAAGLTNGACVDLYATRATTQLSSGANLTLDYVAMPPRTAITCMEFSGGVDTVVMGVNGGDNAAADPGPFTITGSVSAERLFARATACETNLDTYVVTSGWNGFTGQGTASTSDSGTAVSSMGVRGEYRIATEDPSLTSDPSWTATSDCASALGALR